MVPFAPRFMRNSHEAAQAGEKKSETPYLECTHTKSMPSQCGLHVNPYCRQHGSCVPHAKALGGGPVLKAPGCGHRVPSQYHFSGVLHTNEHRNCARLSTQWPKATTLKIRFSGKPAGRMLTAHTLLKAHELNATKTEAMVSQLECLQWHAFTLSKFGCR